MQSLRVQGPRWGDLLKLGCSAKSHLQTGHLDKFSTVGQVAKTGVLGLWEGFLNWLVVEPTHLQKNMRKSKWVQLPQQSG